MAPPRPRALCDFDHRMRAHLIASSFDSYALTQLMFADQVAEHRWVKVGAVV